MVRSSSPALRPRALRCSIDCLFDRRDAGATLTAPTPLSACVPCPGLTKPSIAWPCGLAAATRPTPRRRPSPPPWPPWRFRPQAAAPAEAALAWLANPGRRRKRSDRRRPRRSRLGDGLGRARLARGVGRRLSRLEVRGPGRRRLDPGCQGPGLAAVAAVGARYVATGMVRADGTSSWVEPTAIQLLAIQAEGDAQHPRVGEAVRLLRNRAIPSGGWNYGNSVLLGAPLRPMVQSTGLALAALAGHPEADAEIRPALAYLLRNLSAATTTASMCYALIGLAGHAKRPRDAGEWLSAAAGRSLRDGAKPYALALTALAALGSDCPWYGGR